MGNTVFDRKNKRRCFLDPRHFESGKNISRTKVRNIKGIRQKGPRGNMGPYGLAMSGAGGGGGRNSVSQGKYVEMVEKEYVSGIVSVLGYVISLIDRSEEDNRGNAVSILGWLCMGRGSVILSRRVCESPDGEQVQ